MRRRAARWHQEGYEPVLGEPYEFDKFDSRYLMDNGRARLFVAYDASHLVQYLSIALPKELRYWR